MANIDKNYLEIQFRLKVHEKNATLFQSFFEDIMQQAIPDFQKIRPYGKRGDEGNDGYMPDEGIYYQVYAPKDPAEKESAAAQKLKKDFQKLKKTWNQISEIKTFYFVFNDKYGGVSIVIQEALAELKRVNPAIEFMSFAAKDLEATFFTLKKEQILSLGFNVDSTNTLRICREILANLEIYMDRGNGSFVLESLDNSKDIIASQRDEGILVEWEIMKCRALQTLERTKQAQETYENLYKRYPNDPRPLLYLAEIHLTAGKYDENEELLNKAEKIDKRHVLLRIERLVRDLRRGKKIDPKTIDERDFPTDPREKSNFYRLYAVALIDQKEFTRAESFVERAISLNPDKLANYLVKLALLEGRLYLQADDNEILKSGSDELLIEIDQILNKIGSWGKLSPRNQVTFNRAKLRAFSVQGNIPEMERLAEESFKLLMQCYFDLTADRLLSDLLMSIQLPQQQLDNLLDKLRKVENGISNYLAKALVFQFIANKTLLTQGKNFFNDVKNEAIVAFISNLEDKKFEEAWNFIKDDLQFAVTIANSAKDFPDLRKKIIKELPDDNPNIQKDKLSLLLNHDESKIDEAFEILKQLDLTQLNYIECRVIIGVARKKKAWDFVILILEKLLAQERNEQIALHMELELFDANLKLERLPKAIEIGENILSDTAKLSRLDDQNKESLLAQTILAILARGENSRAMVLLEKYPAIAKTFEFKLGVEAEVYLKNKEAEKAITSTVDGIRILKTPTPEQYSKLFLLLTEIDHLTSFNPDSLPQFEANSFIKFKGEERWYFVGDGGELDAIKISSKDERYAAFSEKKVGDNVVFQRKYTTSSEYVIEKILPIEKYVFAQSVYHFNKLAAEGNLEAVRVVDVPREGDSIDIKNVLAFMEDTRTGRREFFDLYCQKDVPLAFLAVSEGGLPSAIGLIQNEGRGFVRFSSGEPAEMEKQKEVARRIIAGNPFYIDGTSALILSETGLLEEIYPLLPNIRVPQSVIAMLLKCKERFKYTPGQAGHMQYIQGQLRFSPADTETSENIVNKIEKSVRLFESNLDNVTAISAASKADTFLEQQVPAELCDACVLAQQNGVAVLTEDFLYLQANQIETGKTAPEYFSAFALICTLYEGKKITFEKYLHFFAYLSGYRFRFLQVTVNDIEKAVFGDGVLATVEPQKIKLLNFPLTMSEEYGVPFANSFRVIALFLIRIVADDALPADVAERIFLEILSDFPTKKDKKLLGKLFLAACSREIEKIHGTIIVGTAVQNKLKRLSQLTEIYSTGNNLWTP